jgi:very-short-patch-repair endonuclease
MGKSPSDAEAKLWRMLRGRQLGEFKFRRQYPLAGYILDFYCIKQQLAVESDGGQHTEPAAVKYDDLRTKQLNKLGVRVIRFGDNDVLANPNAVLDEILRPLTEPSPRPSPGLPGEGEKAKTA